jgi:glycosyltransferase involved in cell wall biosynthesis
MESVTKPRILYLYSANSYGGMVKNISLIAQNIDTEKFSATFVALHAPADRGDQLAIAERPGISFRLETDTRRFDIGVLARLAKSLKRNEFDLISAHGHKADVYAWALRHLFNVKLPIVSIAHGWVVPGLKMKVYDWIDKFCMLFFDRVIFVHQQQHREIPFFPARKRSCIFNAVDAAAPLTREQRTAVRNSIGVADTEFVIGFCGRLSPEKGVTTALNALALIRSEQATLVLCGEGPERDSLEKWARDNGVSTRVRFLGFRSDVVLLLGAFDAYISCSTREGLPNNVLEAQAAGLPTVVSNIAPHRELIQNGVNGLLVNPSSSAEFATALERILADGSLATRLGRKAREIVAQKFSIEARMRALEALYSEVLK